MINEFDVIVVMNEATIKFLKKQNKDVSRNIEIKEKLKDKAIFFKIDKKEAMQILEIAGVKNEQSENVYKKLIGADVYYELLYKGKIRNNDDKLVVKYEARDIFKK